MKNSNIYLIAALLTICGLFGCDNLMEDLQKNDVSAYEELLEADANGLNAFVSIMQTNIKNFNTSWQYQVQQNLNADHYSGYMMSANPFGGGGINSQYNMNDGWNSYVFSVANVNLAQFQGFKTKALPRFPDYHAYGKILKIFSALPMVDAFGTFPYKDFGNGTDVKWDDLDVVYETMVSELNSTIDTLTLYVGDGERSGSGNRIASDLSSYSGDYVKFIQLANSLKLRLAIRMADVAPQKAKQIAEEAVANEFGTIDNGAGTYSINVGNYNNPLWQIAAWGDIQMGSDMESFMKGYNDPRLQEYFTAATDSAVLGQYKGIRQGAEVKTGEYTGYSKPQFSVKAPIVLFTLAELYFLKAEGALRNWNMNGAVEDFYKAGVSASFDQYGLADVSTYLASDATPMDFTDTKHPEWSYDNTTAVTPNFADAISYDDKLEKIITQKWIAIYPDGAEAWADFRRTGYPKLKSIPKDYNDAIPDGEFIKRLKIPSAMIGLAESRYTEAIQQYFGGQDNAGQKVWWDVN